MGHAILTELVLVMAASVAAAALLRKIHVPPVVGFIVAGVLIGPGGLGLVGDRRQIEVVAEVGVILLLFTVGLKIRIGTLWSMRRAVFGAGAAQVLVTGGAVAAALTAVGQPPAQAVVWAAMVALSSTALVMWLLEGSGDTDSPHGRTIVSVLLFQDLAVVPIMLSLPLLAGHTASALELGWLLGRSVAVLVLVVVGARFLFPWVTTRIVATGSRELFTLTTVLAAVGTALVFGHFGLSMALGAFLAGIVVSESEYVGRMIDEITPLRDVFNSLFFVSMGMLVDPRLWLDRPLVSLGGVVAVVVLKAVVVGAVAALFLRRPFSAAAVALGLAQIGEFSIVVAVEAGRLGLLDEAARQLFLAIAVPTLVVTPFLMRLGSRFARREGQLPGATVQDITLSDHLVIVGYGLNGRNVARALRLLAVPHITVDRNPYNVDEVRSSGGLALEGDASHPAVLEAAGIERARGLVTAIPDAAETRAVVAAARALNPEVLILARTRYLREVEPLIELGADQVVPEEFETSLELTGRVLSLYGAPPYVVAREKAALRREGYGLLRGDPEIEAGHPDLDTLCRLPGVERIKVEGGAAADGASLASLDLRRRTGATVLALIRADDLTTNPAPDHTLLAGDEFVVLTDGEGLERLRTLVEADRTEP